MSEFIASCFFPALDPAASAIRTHFSASSGSSKAPDGIGQ